LAISVLMGVKVEVDEELWYGASSDETAEAEAAKSMAARMGRIVGAKPFPAAAQRLSQLTQDPNCQMDEVVAVLESDPALSARLLRLVNSVGFSLRTACTSVRHAAALVGTEKLNQVASTAAILDMYESGGEKAKELLEHATVVGALCRYLAFHFGLQPDELFTCGFLHDIGKLMLLDTEGAAYLDLLGPETADFDTTFVEERKRFGFDHALLAGHVLAAWNIPHPVPKVVAWHHHVTRAYAESTAISQMVSTLRLADAMSFALSKPDIEVQIETLARMEAASYMDISEGQLAAMWEEVRALSERARAVFRGEKVEDAQLAHTSRPSGASLRAVARAKNQDRVSMNRASMSGVSAPPSSERTRQFPCVVCGSPSYAQRCSACHGYMCPLHVAGEDEWCQQCRRDYEEAGIPAIRPIVSTLFGALAGGLVAAAFFGAASAGAQRPLRIMLGPTLILMLLGMLAGVGQRWIRRWWFLRSRPSRASIVPTAVETLLEAAVLHNPQIVEIDSPPFAVPIPESEKPSFREAEPSSPAQAEQLSLMNPEIPALPALPQLDVPNVPSQRPRSSPPRARTWMSSRTPHPSAPDRLGSMPPPGVPVGTRAKPTSLEPRADEAEEAERAEPTSLEPRADEAEEAERAEPTSLEPASRASLEPTSLEPTSLEPTSLVSLEPTSLEPSADEVELAEPLSLAPHADEAELAEPPSLEPSSLEPPSLEQPAEMAPPREAAPAGTWPEAPRAAPALPPEAERPSEPLPISEERVVENAERAETALPAAQSAAGGGRPSSRSSGSVRSSSPDPRDFSGRSERPSRGANRPSGPARLGDRTAQRSRSGPPASSPRPRSAPPVISGARSKAPPAAAAPTVRASSVAPRAIAALSPTMLDMPAPVESRSAPAERAPAPLHSGPAPSASRPPSESPASTSERASPEPRGQTPSADTPLVPAEGAVQKDPKPATRGDWSSVLDALDAGGGW
jgi:HD-like signal output (HDOD) protein